MSIHPSLKGPGQGKRHRNVLKKFERIVKLKEQSGTTAIAVTHDMQSAYKISDRIAMLYEGKILEIGTPQQIQNSSNPIVTQFINGSSHGPIPVPRI